MRCRITITTTKKHQQNKSINKCLVEVSTFQFKDIQSFLIHTHINYKIPNVIHAITCLGCNEITSEEQREREMFYLTTHSTHFIYGYMASDIWLRTILIVRKETRCHHIGYSFRLTARVLLYLHIPVVEHWLEREIAQWVHPMKDRSDDPQHHERTLLPRSYISLNKETWTLDAEINHASNMIPNRPQYHA